MNNALEVIIVWDHIRADDRTRFDHHVRWDQTFLPAIVIDRIASHDHRPPGHASPDLTRFIDDRLLDYCIGADHGVSQNHGFTDHGP